MSRNIYKPKTRVALQGTNIPTINLHPNTTIYSLSKNGTVNLVGKVSLNVTFTSIPQVTVAKFTLTTPCRHHPSSKCKVARGEANLFLEPAPGITPTIVATTFDIRIKKNKVLITFTLADPMMGFKLTDPIPITLQETLHFDITYVETLEK